MGLLDRWLSRFLDDDEEEEERAAPPPKQGFVEGIEPGFGAEHPTHMFRATVRRVRLYHLRDHSLRTSRSGIQG